MRHAGGPVAGIPDLHQNKKLLHVIEAWLRTEKKARLEQKANGLPIEGPPKHSTPMMPSKHMAFFR